MNGYPNKGVWMRCQRWLHERAAAIARHQLPDSVLTAVVRGSRVIVVACGAALFFNVVDVRCQEGTVIGSFTIKESFGVSHPEQIIDFDLTNEVDWANAYLIGPEGSEVPYQVLSSGKLAVQADLPAAEQKTWTLISGRPPATLSAGLGVREEADYYEITNGLTGVRVPKPVTTPLFTPAPVQGVLYRDGRWTATGPNPLEFPNQGNRPTEVTNMTLHFVEYGPLKVVVAVVYGLWRDAYAYIPEPLAPEGPGFYQCTIEVQAGQPSILFEEEADSEVQYWLDAYPGLQPNQARYRGHNATRPEYGVEPGGATYGSSLEGARNDATVPLDYSQFIYPWAGTSDRSRIFMAVWNPWIQDGGWYWQVYDTNAAPDANLLGIFAGKASRAWGASGSGTGIYTGPPYRRDIVSRTDAAGNLHVIYQTQTNLWYVSFDESLAPSVSEFVATGLEPPDLLIQDDGRVSVLGFRSDEGRFVFYEKAPGSPFQQKQFETTGASALTVKDPYAYQASSGTNEFVFLFGEYEAQSGGLLFWRPAGEDLFTLTSVIESAVVDYQFGREYNRPSFSRVPDGRIVLLFGDNRFGGAQLTQAVIENGTQWFGPLPGGCCDIEIQGTAIDPESGLMFSRYNDGRVRYKTVAEPWSLTSAVVPSHSYGQGPNRRTLTTSPTGDALLAQVVRHVFNPGTSLMSSDQPVFCRRVNGVWSEFPEADELKLSATRVHYHPPTEQFLLVGWRNNQLTLYGWKPEESNPRLVRQLPETEAREGGVAMQIYRRDASIRFSPRVRFDWGLFTGVKGEDLVDPYQPQPINRQMNLHGGVNLNLLHRIDLDFPDAARGYGALFMDGSIVQQMIARVRADDAYRAYLYNADPSVAARAMVDLWADTSGVKTAAAVADISGLAKDLLDALVNREGIYTFDYCYWVGGVEMNRRGTLIDAALASDLTSPEQRAQIKAAAALFANILWDDDFVPLFEGHALGLGTANMPVQQSSYRDFYALMLSEHPTMRDRAAIVEARTYATLEAVINEYGAHLACPHYISPGFEPVLDSLLQLRMLGKADPFATQPKLERFSEFYLQLTTPPEIRFGGRRKLVALGNGSTEASEVYGQLANGYSRANPGLSARLMGTWLAHGKPHSGFFATTLLSIDESLPALDPRLGDANTPGYCSVFRHGWGTSNESALWFMDGNFYCDHREEDYGAVMIYALGAPLALDWGAFYTPLVSDPHMHNVVVPEALLPQPWDQDSPPLSSYYCWRSAVLEDYTAFQTAGQAKARHTDPTGLVWTRTVRSFRADESHPIYLIEDEFSGPGSDAGKVFNLHLMAEGTVETLVGPVSPPLRTYEFNKPTPKTELPSVTEVISLPAGANRFRFTGQWLIDWDLYTLSDSPQQALLGNWAHQSPGMGMEGVQFLEAQGRDFEERQHILRVRGTGSFRTLILPHRKQEQLSNLAVTLDGTNLICASDTQQTIIARDWAAATNSNCSALTAFWAEAVEVFGLRVGGGPAELVVAPTRVTLTASGPAGPRHFRLPGLWHLPAAVSYSEDEYILDHGDVSQSSAILDLPVTITSPTQGARVVGGTSVLVTIEVDSVPNGVAAVELYANNTLLAHLLEAPWTFAWTNAPDGTHVLSARLRDPSGLEALSVPVQLTVANAPPELAAVAPQAVAEGFPLTFAVSAVDPDRPAQTLTYSLGPGAPAGTLIDSLTGVFEWTPTEAQGPSTNLITVLVIDDGSPPLGATNTLTVIVQEMNAAPTLAAFGNQEVDEHQALTFSVSGSDADDIPANIITLSVSNLPEGATFDPATGKCAWTPAEAQGPGSYTVTFTAVDDGVPPLSASETISITVREVDDPPVANPLAVTTDEDAPLAIALTGSDPENGTLSFSVGTGPSHGAFSGTPPDLIYLPTTNYHGSDSFTFTANDGAHASAEAHVSITVQPVNDLPTVALTRPVAAAQFIAPATIELEAEATDVDGTIAKVEFFEATALLGEATVASHLLTWSNVVAGSHVVTARAVDDEAGEATSTPLTISVLASLRSAEVLADGTFRFRLAGEPNREYAVEVSDDLAQWTPVATNRVDASGAMAFGEAAVPGLSDRFYRARLLDR